MSSSTSKRISDLVNRVLIVHADRTNVELAATLRVTEGYVRKLRRGWRPSRVREDLMLRLMDLSSDTPRAPRAVAESAAAWSVGGAARIRGRLDQIHEMVSWAMRERSQLEAQLDAEILSPTADEVEAGAAILESLPPPQSQKPAKNRKRA